MLRRLRKASLALQGGKEVIIRDNSGKIVYVHSERGFQRYLMIAPIHLRLAPGESHTETMEVPLVYTRGLRRESRFLPETTH